MQRIKRTPFEEKERVKNVKIKPCPFCGNIAFVNFTPGGGSPNWAVICRGCFARIDYQITPRQAINAWNKRTNNIVLREVGVAGREEGK